MGTRTGMNDQELAEHLASEGAKAFVAVPETGVTDWEQSMMDLAESKGLLAACREAYAQGYEFARGEGS